MKTGASWGCSLQVTNMLATYSVAMMIPGIKPAINSLPIERWATVATMIAKADGGIIWARPLEPKIGPRAIGVL